MVKLPVGFRQFAKAVLWKPSVLAVGIAYSIIPNVAWLYKRFIEPFTSKEITDKWAWLMLTENWPWYVWLIGLLVILLLRVAWVSYHLYEKARKVAVEESNKLKEHLKPNLKISHDPADRDNLEINETAFSARTVRIKVENVGGKSIKNVLVQLLKVEPPALNGVLSIPLRHMHWRGKILNPGDWLYVDCFYKDARAERIQVTHDVTGLDRPDLTSISSIPSRHFWIHASGSNCPTETRRFLLFYNEDRLISIRED